MKTKISILFSGGKDSTLLALKALHKGDDVLLIHFEYEHPAKDAERQATINVANMLKTIFSSERIELITMPLPINAQSMFIGNGQVGNRVVVNRNAIFLNMAINIAAQHGCNEIQYGAVLDDESGYLDCRRAFLEKINAIAEDWNIKITAPFMNQSKHDINYGMNLGPVVDELIWRYCSSCYEPTYDPESDTYIACGSCSSCLSNKVQQ